MMSPEALQHFMDYHYRVLMEGKPCCAGCDHWEAFVINAGDCLISKLVPSHERMSLFEIKNLTLDIGAGHVITPRDYKCDNFIDTYDWRGHLFV